MPAQVTTGILQKKYGNKLDQMIQAHANDETTYGIIQLPAGINNGIAQLFECRFGEYKTGDNKGQLFFQARATVISPESVLVNGTEIPVKGLQTMLQEALCDTKQQGGKIQSQEDHVAKVLNYCRQLAGETATGNLKGGGDLERLMQLIKQKKPYFRFSTTDRIDQKTKEVTGVWENWHGGKGLEGWTPDQPPPMEDGTAASPSVAPSPTAGNGVKANGATRAPGTTTTGRMPPVKTPPKAAVTATTPAEAPAEEAAGGENFSEFDDLPSLAERADGGDAKAQRILTEHGVKVGLEEHFIHSCDNWTIVAEAIMNPPKKPWTQKAPPAAATPPQANEEGESVEAAEGEVTEGEGETTEEEYVPEAGHTCLYPPINPKTRQRMEPVQCVVHEVQADKKTVTLKNLIDNKSVYKNVKWENMLPPE